MTELHGFAPYLAIFLLGLVALGVVYAHRSKSVVRTVPSLLGLVTTATAFSLMPVGWFASLQWSTAVASAALVGGLIAYYFTAPDLRGLRARLSRAGSDFIADRRMAFLACAFLAAVLLTIPFAYMAERDPGNFWPSYYASWAANLVFFALLGVAGIVVSLQRPEKDEFSRRVRILFGGRHDAAVEHITDTIRKIGYYAVEVHRTYRILDFNAELEAALVKVEHKTITQNFYDDLEASDLANFGFMSDTFDPPMRPVGRLLAFSVNGVNRLPHQLVYDSGQRFQHSEQMEIPKGGRCEVEVINEAWYKLSEDHEYEPNRFAKKIHVTIVYEGATQGMVVPITVLLPHQEDITLAYRIPRSFPAIPDRKPDTPTFTFRIGMPVKQ